MSDANLFLGRLLPDYFPKIFGPTEDQPLDVDIVREKFSQLADEINASSPGDAKTVDEVVYGFIKVANEAMCRPIRSLTEAKGHNTSHHTLAVFGGAGGQHGKDSASIELFSLLNRCVYSLRYCPQPWYQ